MRLTKKPPVPEAPYGVRFVAPSGRSLHPKIEHMGFDRETGRHVFRATHPQPLRDGTKLVIHRLFGHTELVVFLENA